MGGGGGKSDPFCALLWRILTWCSRKKAQARHIHTSTMSRLGIHCVKTQCLVMSTPLGGGYIIFAFFAVRCPLSDVRRPMSGVTHGFRSFKGKVLELLSPNLVCRLIGSVACLGLLLAVVPLLLTE